MLVRVLLLYRRIHYGYVFRKIPLTQRKFLGLGHGDKIVTDHINHNGLDNRKVNLRPATFSQNLCNRPKRCTNTRSKYKGLEWDKTQGTWKARIQHNGRKKYLGSFKSESSAARAYDAAARKYHKDFAILNFHDS